MSRFKLQLRDRQEGRRKIFIECRYLTLSFALSANNHVFKPEKILTNIAHVYMHLVRVRLESMKLIDLLLD